MSYVEAVQSPTRLLLEVLSVGMSARIMKHLYAIGILRPAVLTFLQVLEKKREDFVVEHSTYLEAFQGEVFQETQYRICS